MRPVKRDPETGFGPALTVAQLIVVLQKCPPDAPVHVFVDWKEDLPVCEVSPEDCVGHVVLGTDLPPELYARDFKDD